MFFIDPIKFPDFVHTQKRDPQTNLKSASMMWDFWSLNPEILAPGDDAVLRSRHP